MGIDADKSVQSALLGTHSARGMLYLFASSTAMKLISFAAQVILSYLLSAEDYGVIGLAFTITVFIQVFEQAGVGDVLVQRESSDRGRFPHSGWHYGSFEQPVNRSSRADCSGFLPKREVVLGIAGFGAGVASQRADGHSAGRCRGAAIPGTGNGQFGKSHDANGPNRGFAASVLGHIVLCCLFRFPMS